MRAVGRRSIGAPVACFLACVACGAACELVAGLGGEVPLQPDGGSPDGGGGAAPDGGRPDGGAPCKSVADCPATSDCTTEACTAGKCVMGLQPAGMACLGGAGVCDGAGSCVQCLSNADCATSHPMAPICDLTDRKCVSCTDGIKDGQETGVDCGGPDCGACLGEPCAMGHMYGVCGDGTACASQSHNPDNVCCDMPCTGLCEGCVSASTGMASGTCAQVLFGMDPYMRCGATGTPMAGGCGHSPNTCACNDGVKDGAETDVDCGGGTCPGCAGGKQCNSDSDCAVEVAGEISICNDGACCESDCKAQCHLCNAVGQCVNAPPGASDPTCVGNTVCGAGTTGCVGKAGAPCSASGACLSNVCAAGACAKSPSGGPCNTSADCTTGTCQNFVCM